MNLKDLMTREVKFIHPDAFLRDAAALMDDLDVGSLPVCDGERLVGIVTDRDMVVRSVSAGQDPNSTPVREAMTAPVICCFEDQGVLEVARVMEDKQIRRLPVLSRDRRLVGMVALGDIAVDEKDDRLSGEILERISERDGRRADRARGNATEDSPAKDEELSKEFQEMEDENVVLHTPAGEIPDTNRPRAADEALGEDIVEGVDEQADEEKSEKKSAA